MWKVSLRCAAYWESLRDFWTWEKWFQQQEQLEWLFGTSLPGYSKNMTEYVNMFCAGYGARFWPGGGHLGTDEDQTARANDGRRSLPSETAATSVWRLYNSTDVDSCLSFQYQQLNSLFVCFPCRSVPVLILDGFIVCKVNACQRISC